MGFALGVADFIFLALSLALSAGVQMLEEVPADVTPADAVPVDGVPVDGAAPVDGALQEAPDPVSTAGEGSGGEALSVGEVQLGKPFALNTDGPDTFSCVGLMRYILRTIGADPDALWVPEEYLSRYPAVARADLQHGDIVIYPGWATMYAGNGQLLNSNKMEGIVTHTPSYLFRARVYTLARSHS